MALHVMLGRGLAGMALIPRDDTQGPLPPSLPTSHRPPTVVRTRAPPPGDRSNHSPPGALGGPSPVEDAAGARVGLFPATGLTVS